MNVRTLLSVALAAAYSLLSTALFADVTYYVRPAATAETIDGGSGTEADPFHHPQMAINAASGTELTTIVLMAGTYNVWTNAYVDQKTKTYTADEYRVINIAKGNIHIIAETSADAWPVKLDAGSSGCTRAIHIYSGLENVKISGIKTINGYSSSNQNGDWRATIAIVSSGTIEDCLFVGKRRYRCGYIKLSGSSTVLRRCELTESSSPSLAHAGGGGTMVPLSVGEGAKVENCYVHDLAYGTPASGNACSGQGISVSGTGSLVRNTIVKNITCGYTTVSGGNGAGISVGSGATVENCTLVGCRNLKERIGGLYVSSSTASVRNCIVWGNVGATADPLNDIGLASEVPDSCVQYSVSSSGISVDETNWNMNTNPELAAADGFSIAADSPVAGKGCVDDSWMTNATDYKGNPRLYNQTVSPGAVEPQGRVSKFTVTPRFESDSVGRGELSVVVDALVSGTVGSCTYSWDFGDGSSPEVSTSATRATHDYDAVGYYPIRLTVTDDKGAHVSDAMYATVVGDTCFVSTNGAAIPPYDTWAKATSNIQDAVDLKPSTVWVSNGVYRVSFTTLDTKGIKLYSATRLVSVGGPTNTIVLGGLSSPGQTAASAVSKPLVTMTNAQASVEGFTFRNTYPPMIKATAGRVGNCIVANPYSTTVESLSSFVGVQFSGSAIVSNCTFDASGMEAGGVNGGTVFVSLSGQACMDRCKVRNVGMNLGKSGAGNLLRCAVSVGASACLRNSFVSGLRAYIEKDKMEAQVSAVSVDGSIENCTITDSDITAMGGGGGLAVQAGARVHNVISVGHILTVGGVVLTNDVVNIGAPTTFENNLIGSGELPASAVDCLPVGTDPQFVDDGAGYRITKDSPCYNAGKNLGWCRRKGLAKDLDGQERHCNRPDIGCYEVQRDTGFVMVFH